MKKIMYIFSYHYIYFFTLFDEFENMLEAGFQRLTCGFQGCRFRMSNFRINLKINLFTFV